MGRRRQTRRFRAPLARIPQMMRPRRRGRPYLDGRPIRRQVTGRSGHPARAVLMSRPERHAAHAGAQTSQQDAKITMTKPINAQLHRNRSRCPCRHRGQTRRHSSRPRASSTPAGRRLNRLTKGALARLAEAESFDKAKVGETVSLSFPAGLAAEALIVCKLPRRPSVEEARKAGARWPRHAARGT